MGAMKPPAMPITASAWAFCSTASAAAKTTTASRSAKPSVGGIIWTMRMAAKMVR